MSRHALSLCALIALAARLALPADVVKRRFLCVDNHGKVNRLIHVNQFDPSQSWVVEIPGPKSRELQLVGGGRVLVSHFTGAAEYSLADGARGWSVKGHKGVNSARRLPSGNTLLGANTKAGITIYEVDRAGAQVGKLVLSKLRNIRLLRRLANGNTLLTAVSPWRAVEVDASGNIAWQARLPGKGYKAMRLANGNTLCSTGDEVKVVEIAPSGQIVHCFGGKARHPDLRLDFFSGFDLLPNGNVVAANWLGHGKIGQGPHLVEFDRDNRCVWQWEDHKTARTVTNVLVLDREQEPNQ